MIDRRRSRAQQVRHVGIAFVLVAGCGGEPKGSPPGAALIKDSAPARVSVSVFGPDDLYRVVGVIPAGDGTLVFETRPSRVRHLNANGVVRSLDEIEGEGPGEHQEITSVSQGDGDSIVVFDASSRRVSILNPDGVFTRSEQLRGSERPILGRLRQVAAGWVVGAGSQIRPGENPPGPYRPEHEILLFASNGNFVRPITTVGGPEIVFGEAGGFVRPLLPRETRWDAADEHLAIVDGGRASMVRIAGGGSSSIEALASTARSNPLAPAGHEEILDSLAVGLSESERTRLVTTYDLLSLPDSLPVFGSVVRTGSGAFWISEYADPRRGTRRWYRILPGHSEPTSSVELPRRVEILHASDSLLLGTTRDEYGAERLVRVSVSR